MGTKFPYLYKPRMSNKLNNIIVLQLLQTYMVAPDIVKTVRL